METGDERTIVYRFYGTDDQLLYVGVTSKPGVRWDAHTKQQEWWPKVARQTAEWYPSRDKALQAERAAIQSERPIYNTMHSVGLSALRLTDPWSCPACRFETTDPVEQVEHMEREVAKFAARRGPSEDLERLARSVERASNALTRAEVTLARSQGLFSKAANEHRAMVREPRKRVPPIASPEQVRKLLDDLDQILGDDRVRLAELPAFLRRHDSAWLPYQTLRGTDLALVLKAQGVRVTNSGNVLRLNPADLRKLIA